MGSANVPGFANYELQYGVSHDPGAFSPPVWGPAPNTVENDILGYWDTSGLAPGPHTLRLIVRDQFGTEYERRVNVFVDVPPPAPVEPTPTWTPTWTPIPAETPVVVETQIPTETPTPAVVETPIPEVTVEEPAPAVPPESPPVETEAQPTETATPSG
jgi:hypothetical protein